MRSSLTEIGCTGSPSDWPRGLGPGLWFAFTGGVNASLGTIASVSVTAGVTSLRVLVSERAHSTTDLAPAPPMVANPLKSGVLKKYSRLLGYVAPWGVSAGCTALAGYPWMVTAPMSIETTFGEGPEPSAAAASC